MLELRVQSRELLQHPSLRMYLLIQCLLQLVGSLPRLEHEALV
jgi:hypothetical protein